MLMCIVSGIPLLIVIIAYQVALNRIEAKEKLGKSDVSDAFLLLLIGFGFGTPFALLFAASIFIAIGG